MSALLRPIARTGPVDDPEGALAPAPLPLAGSRLAWFDMVHRGSDAAGWQALRPDGLSPDARTRLSAPRPPLLGLSLDRPRVMGILNVTPDSFSDGGRHAGVRAALERAREMAAEADIIDIGGESTRPGAETVPEAEEIARTAPVIAAIRAEGITTPISIDTRKAAVAHAALEAGADMVNDVSAFTFDPELAALVAERGVPVCLMHAQGTPETMQREPRYDDVLAEVADWLRARMTFAREQGIAAERLIIDPGIGFGKTLAHNLALLRGLSALHALGAPVLLGASRKRFIGTIAGEPVAERRLGGSLQVALHGAAQGVQILRVHDTLATSQALALFMALAEREPGQNEGGR